MSTRLAAPGLAVEVAPFRVLGGAMLALGAALPHVPGDPGLPCPLRSTTGVPCPLCGMTTSVKAVMRADVAAALAANPFGVAAVAVAIVLLLRPRLSVVQVPVPLLAVAALGSWLFQLARYDIV